MQKIYMGNYDNDVDSYKVSQGRDICNRRSAKRNLRTDEPPQPFARSTVSDLKNIIALCEQR